MSTIYTSRKLFISAGHSNVSGQDMGAVGYNNVKEGDLTVQLRKLVIHYLKYFGFDPISDKDSNVTWQTVKIIKSELSNKDVAIDLHFNAASNKFATGTEVLVPFRYSKFEFELSKVLSANIARILGIRDRGVKTEAQSARGRLIFMTPNCENILIEICFITNENDMRQYNLKEELVAYTIAKCIVIFLMDN